MGSNTLINKGKIMSNKKLQQNNALLHFYRKARQWQIETYGSTGLHIDGKDQREFAGGGSCVGCHAEAAISSARGQIHFRADLKATIKQYKKRSAAAKRGWKNRRVAA